MKRTVLGAFLICLVSVALAAPAFAQRDPFDPVIDTSVTTTGGVPSGNGGEAPRGPSAPEVRTDVFPDTGASTSGWLAIAYVLLASGAALVVFAKTREPAPLRRR